MNSIVRDVRSRVDPDQDERTALDRVSSSLASEVQKEATQLGYDIDTVQTGSTARGTWVSGDRDIDLFILFNPTLSTKELKQRGLEIGERVLPDGDTDYASHPYRVGNVDGFDIDLVPCFDVDSASEIKSAVDRTPFHTRYLEPKISEQLASDVRVAKMFLKGIGAYGSDVQTQGFSGYLTELLVLQEGGFEEFLQASSEWDIPVKFDPEDHKEKEFSDPLVVIDPTDPERNVAANVSKENLLRLKVNARRFLENPSEAYFERSQESNMGRVHNLAQSRETDVVGIMFPRPEIVDDTLFPQMRRTRESLVGTLERLGFSVIRSTDLANSEVAVMFIELEDSKIANVDKVEGPPIQFTNGMDQFIDQYKNNESVIGPFIEEDRLVVEKPREFTEVKEFVSSDSFAERVAMRDSIETSLNPEESEIVTGHRVFKMVSEQGLEPEITEYYTRSDIK